jgi:hypothetical protein
LASRRRSRPSRANAGRPYPSCVDHSGHRQHALTEPYWAKATELRRDGSNRREHILNSYDIIRPRCGMTSTDPRMETGEREARTPLGRRLEELRRAIVSSGTRLLPPDELEREVAERRGERATSDID